MLQAKEAGLDMAGIAFHVGSQTVSAEPYLKALDIVRELYLKSRSIGDETAHFRYWWRVPDSRI